MIQRNQMTKNTKRVLGLAGWMTLALATLMVVAACQPAAQPVAQSTQPQGDNGGNGPRFNFQMTPASELPAATPVHGSLRTWAAPG